MAIVTTPPIHRELTLALLDLKNFEESANTFHSFAIVSEPFTLRSLLHLLIIVGDPMTDG